MYFAGMIVLTDKNFRENLFPFAHTRHVANIRIGMLTIKEKWEKLLGEAVSLVETDNGIHIPASIIPTIENYKSIIAAAEKNIFLIETESIKIISFPWHIFQLNDFALRQDFALCTKEKTTTKIDESNTVIAPNDIFIEEGAIVKYCTLNASTGPIYIAKGAQIMEGAMIRGPFYLGEDSIVKMGAKIYGATTVGPNCVVGGEIKNSILFEYSNKAHDGYLGDSVIGAWCNLGAGTSNSNVKNSGGNIGYVLEEDTQAIYAGNKAGLLMGDYSRAAINTSFNTGSVVGVCCNIFGQIMANKYTGNFTWGTEQYRYEKVLEDISNWMQFKNTNIDTATINILEQLYGRI
jgi:UDP-N-acetylglucosamine diphosphorylase / glucose-1-phosphate thymidylyltransferase / UDP-N-acetylgalactosamine diphosphorylase / glucosamine-1-phosphate N-acetyltransferase / galactosamine-1-phosphate N-acetyltransferase